MLLVEHDHMIKGISANTADDPLAVGFCQGLRGGFFTCVIPMFLTRDWKVPPYVESRSRCRFRGAVSHL